MAWLRRSSSNSAASTLPSLDEHNEPVIQIDFPTEADISLALVLAGYAFETYETTKRKGIESIGVDDTKIIFADLRYVKSLFAGVLQVNLKRGTFTYNVGRDSSKYTITSVLEKRLDFPSTQTDMEKILSNATHEGSHQRILASVLSKEQEETCGHVWDESYNLLVEDPFHAELNLRSFENGFENCLKPEPHLLGVGTLSVKDIIKQGYHGSVNDIAVPLFLAVKPSPVIIPKDKKSTPEAKSETEELRRSGSLLVSVQYVPFLSDSNKPSVRFVLPDEISTPAADPASAPPILDTKAYLLSILPDSTVENTPTLQVWQNLLVNSAALTDVVENNSGKSFEEKEEDKVIGERVIDGEREYKREGVNEKEVVEVRAVGATIGEGGAVEGSGRAQEMQCPPFVRKITAKMRDSIHRAIIGNTYHGKYVDRICNIENKKRGTEAIVWATVKDRVVVIGFRGTEAGCVPDILADLNILQTLYDSANPHLAGVKVHKGFMKCFRSVRAAVLQILRSMLVPNNVKAVDDKEKKEKTNKWMIYFTGHSMGGCLAALCAFEIGRIRAGHWGGEEASAQPDPASLYRGDLEFLAVLRDAHITMYSFGAPRCGNPKFCDMYNILVPESFRVENYRDIVPKIPRTFFKATLSYAYVGGVLEVREKRTQPEPIVGTFLSSHFSDMLAGVVEGDAVCHHITTGYYTALRDAAGCKNMKVVMKVDA